MPTSIPGVFRKQGFAPNPETGQLEPANIEVVVPPNPSNDGIPYQQGYVIKTNDVGKNLPIPELPSTPLRNEDPPFTYDPNELDIDPKLLGGEGSPINIEFVGRENAPQLTREAAERQILALMNNTDNPMSNATSSTALAPVPSRTKPVRPTKNVTQQQQLLLLEGPSTQVGFPRKKTWVEWFNDNSSTILGLGILGAAGYAAYKLYPGIFGDSTEKDEETLEEIIDSENYLYLYEPKIIVTKA